MQKHELEIKMREFEIRRAEIAVEFAKYGFGGTLAAAIAGMLLVLSLLSLLDAMSTEFTFGVRGAIAGFTLIAFGCLGFGVLSLRQPLKMLAKLGDISVGLGGDDDKLQRDDLTSKTPNAPNDGRTPKTSN